LLDAAGVWADGLALTSAADVYAFSLTFYKLIVDKHITKSERPTRP
jgi:hypothetical protein